MINFPREDDEGEIDCALTVKDNTVIMAFPKPITWLGLDYETAKKLGTRILELAERIKQ